MRIFYLIFSAVPLLALIGCSGDDSAPELTATEVEIERWEIETPTNNLVSGRPMLRLGDSFTLTWDVAANGVAEIKLLFADAEFGEAPEHEQVFYRKRCPTVDSCELSMSIECIYTQGRDIVCADARGTNLQVFSDAGETALSLELRARGRLGNTLRGFLVDFE